MHQEQAGSRQAAGDEALQVSFFTCLHASPCSLNFFKKYPFSPRSSLKRHPVSHIRLVGEGSDESCVSAL